MTDPLMQVVSSAPGWKVRVLAQIQDVAADWSVTERRGYEHYRGDERDALSSWRLDLYRLKERRTDLEARAAAVGLPQSGIDAVREHGYQGRRSADSFPGLGSSANSAREVLVDAVAGDMWQLQHMLVLGAARQQRLFAAGMLTEPEIKARAQFDRNAVGLWARAGMVAAALQLSVTERDRLWATDVQEWAPIVATTVARYHDHVLERRWRAHARLDIELPALQNMREVTAQAPDTADRRASRVPLLGHMIDAAEQAVRESVERGLGRPGGPIAAAVLDVLPDPDAIVTGQVPGDPDGDPVREDPGLGL